MTILDFSAIEGGRHHGALCEAVSREGAGWDSDLLASIGVWPVVHAILQAG
nr:hypothetical protein [Salmonella enterica]